MRQTPTQLIAQALDFAQFMAWVALQDAGIWFPRGDCCRCPLGAYLADVVGFPVIVDTTRCYPADDRDSWVRSPGWACHLVAEIDEDDDNEPWLSTISGLEVYDILSEMEV
jgi:hypothetical protein